MWSFCYWLYFGGVGHLYKPVDATITAYTFNTPFNTSNSAGELSLLSVKNKQGFSSYLYRTHNSALNRASTAQLNMATSPLGSILHWNNTGPVQCNPDKWFQPALLFCKSHNWGELVLGCSRGSSLPEREKEAETAMSEPACNSFRLSVLPSLSKEWNVVNRPNSNLCTAGLDTHTQRIVSALLRSITQFVYQLNLITYLPALET